MKRHRYSAKGKADGFNKTLTAVTECYNTGKSGRAAVGRRAIEKS